MAPKLSKRQQAAAKASARANSSSVPKPFEPAPESLRPFLDALDPAAVYMVHVDRHTIAFKQQIFTVPVLLNVAIVLGLAYRASFVLTHYLDLFWLSLGVPTAAAVDTAALSSDELSHLTLRRFGMVLIDFVLFRYIGAWAWLFFVGDGLYSPAVSPARWRWAVGFRPAEVVVRSSATRNWGAADFWKGLSPGAQIQPDNDFMQTRLVPNLNPAWMKDRTGYMMMGRDFDLDWAAMVRAHGLVDGKVVPERDLELSVFVCSPDESIGWCVWRLVEDEDEDDGAAAAAAAAAAAGPELSDSEQQARHRIEAFRDRLQAMDKDALFYRFIEILQYESSQPGGFTAERQAAALSKARDAFERESVGFDRFVDSIGGRAQLPGFDRP